MEITELVGKTIKQITIVKNEDDEIKQLEFYTTDHLKFRMYGESVNWGSVILNDICGDLDDLCNNPVLDAREESNNNHDPRNRNKFDTIATELNPSWTWTFYIISTIKGTVTLRWLGTSNGYYSESVTFEKVEEV